MCFAAWQTWSGPYRNWFVFVVTARKQTRCPTGGTLTSLDARLNVTHSGRFSIDVSPEPPATLGQPGTNWLRQDFPDAPVQFVFRIYWGDESVRRNTYHLPPIRRVGGAERAVAEA